MSRRHKFEISNEEITRFTLEKSELVVRVPMQDEYLDHLTGFTRDGSRPSLPTLYTQYGSFGGLLAVAGLEYQGSRVALIPDNPPQELRNKAIEIFGPNTAPDAPSFEQSTVNETSNNTSWESVPTDELVRHLGEISLELNARLGRQ